MIEKGVIIQYIITCPEGEERVWVESIGTEQSVELPKGAIKDRGIIALCLPDTLELKPIQKLPNGYTRFRVRLAYSDRLIDNDPVQFFNLLFGNISLKRGILIEDIELPEEFLSLFPGPSYGIQGIREICKRPRGAFLCSALKPLGAKTEAFAKLAKELAMGGIHFIKDDHNLTNQAFCPFKTRVRAMQKVLRAMDSDCIYLPNITGPLKCLEKGISMALDEGVKGFLVNPFLIGFDTFRHLRMKYPVLWMAHPAFSGTFFNDRAHGISPGLLLGRMMRLLGADMMIFPLTGGRFTFTINESMDIANNLRRDETGMFKPSIPVLSGGLSVSNVPDILSRFGEDIMLNIGGSLMIQETGLEQATRQIVTLLNTPPEGKSSWKDVHHKTETLKVEKPSPEKISFIKPGVTRQIKSCEWEGFKKSPYKPQGYNFKETTRTELFVPSAGEAGFDVRYFEIAPGGYTSLEKHAHIHFIIGVRGRGEVKTGETWQTIMPNAIALIPPNCPHQLRNNHSEMFGFFCIVDHVRDIPIELG